MENMENLSLLNQISQLKVFDDDSNAKCGEDYIYPAEDKDSSDSSILNREWDRRHNHFYTMGYRDGITKGKEDSAQDGFNHGYKESVYAGYNWGLVRGISSVISTLPNGLKERLTGNLQNKDGFQKLYGSTQEISSNKALQIFYSSIQINASGDSHELCDDGGCNQLDWLYKDLIALIRDSVELKVDSSLIKDSAIDG